MPREGNLVFIFAIVAISGSERSTFYVFLEQLPCWDGGFFALSIKRLFAGTDVNPAVRNSSCVPATRGDPRFDVAKVLIE